MKRALCAIARLGCKRPVDRVPRAVAAGLVPKQAYIKPAAE